MAISYLRFKYEIFYEILTQNNMPIYVFLMNFVKMLTSDSHKKL